MKRETIKDLTNVYYYFQGNIRLFLWKNFPILIREHIKEQFLYRARAASDCTDNKSCLACGCLTPELYFANKACSLANIEDLDTRNSLTGKSDPCYPKMLSKIDWLRFKVNADITNIML